MSGGGGGDEIEETAEEKELAQLASERWAEYRDTFRPLENQYMGEVDELGEQGAMAQVTGQAATNVQQGTEMRGINPNTGMPNQGAAFGQARAQATSNAGLGLQEQHKRGLQSVIQIGQGQSAKSLQGLSDVAGQAAQEAQQDAFADFNQSQAWANLAGNVAGAGTRYALQQQDGPSGGNPSQGSQPSTQSQGDFSMGYGLPSWNQGNRGR